MALKKINYNGSSKVILRLCEMVNQLIDGGGGGSKHTIINSSGTSMTDRDGLQFTGATVTDDSVNNRTVVGIPTKLSDFTNDSGFITNTVNNLTNYYLKSETYTQAEVNALISAIVTLSVLVVQTLPTQDIDTHTIYLVPKQTAGTNDVYDEYMYINNAWELIGTTQIDLSNYYTKSEINTLLADKVDKVAGKQLSTEDFTSALKTKLDGIADSADAVSWTQIQASGTKIAEIDINGTSQDVYAPAGSGNPTASDVSYDNTETEIPETDVQGAIDLAFATIDNQNDVLEGLVNPTFTEAQTRTNVASEDSYQTLWGKVKKWFSDLKDLAFIAKDGTSSTKYLRGDGTWQAFPTIPAEQIQSDWNQSDNTKKDYIKNKPTIPTVNNATLTIQKNGTTVQTFTANASSNVTCNITMSKSDVGLGNVDNTADANKSVNYANSAGYAGSAGYSTYVQLGDGIPMVYSESGDINFRFYQSDGVNIGYNNLRNILDRCYIIGKAETLCSNVYLSISDNWNDVTLNYSIRNYEYLGFSFSDADNANLSRMAQIIIPVSDFLNTNGSKDVPIVKNYWNVSSANNVSVCYHTDTKIYAWRGGNVYQYFRLICVGYKKI